MFNHKSEQLNCKCSSAVHIIMKINFQAIVLAVCVTVRSLLTDGLPTTGLLHSMSTDTPVTEPVPQGPGENDAVSETTIRVLPLGTNSDCYLLSRDTAEKALDLYNDYCDDVSMFLPEEGVASNTRDSCRHFVEKYYGHLLLPSIKLAPSATVTKEEMLEQQGSLKQVNHTLTSLVRIGVSALLKNNDCYGGDNPCSITCVGPNKVYANFICKVGSTILSRIENQIMILQTKYDMENADTTYLDIPVSDQNTRIELIFFNIGAIYYAQKQCAQTEKAVEVYGQCS